MIADQQIVIIEWTDAAMHGTDQVSRKEAIDNMGLMDGITAGVLVHEDDRRIVVALDWFSEHDQFRQLASYPKSGVNRVSYHTIEALTQQAVMA